MALPIGLLSCGPARPVSAPVSVDSDKNPVVSPHPDAPQKNDSSDQIEPGNPEKRLLLGVIQGKQLEQGKAQFKKCCQPTTVANPRSGDQECGRSDSPYLDHLQFLQKYQEISFPRVIDLPNWGARDTNKEGEVYLLWSECIVDGPARAANAAARVVNAQARAVDAQVRIIDANVKHFFLDGTNQVRGEQIPLLVPYDSKTRIWYLPLRESLLAWNSSDYSSGSGSKKDLVRWSSASTHVLELNFNLSDQSKMEYKIYFRIKIRKGLKNE